MKPIVFFISIFMFSSLYAISTMNDLIVAIQNISMTSYTDVIDAIHINPWMVLGKDDANNNMTPLMAAIQAQNWPVVDLLLAEDTIVVTINSVDDDGKSALVYALYAQDFSYVTKLLQISTIDLSIIDNQGNTMLMHTVLSGDYSNFSAIMSLIDNSMLDAVNTDSHSALYIAYKNNQIKMFLDLLSAGAVLNPEEFAQEQLLNWLITQRVSVPLLLRCIQLGLDVNEVNGSGKNSLMLALELGYSEIVQLLLTLQDDAGNRMVDFSQEDDDDNNIYNYIISAAPALFQLAVKLLSSAVIIDNSISNKLFWLIKNRISVDLCGLLFDAGLFGVESSLYQSMTPFMYAVYVQNSDMVDYFLAHSTDAELVSTGGLQKNALILALETGNSSLISRLLEAENSQAGALYNVNQSFGAGTKPLMVAVQKGNLDVVASLISYGADASDQDVVGNTALMYAVQSGNLAIVSALLLVMTTSQINMINKNLQTALMFACLTTSTNLLTVLLGKGALYTSADCQGMTPLMYAASAGNAVAVRVLLEFVFAQYGRNKAISYANVQDLYLKSALMYAVEKDSADSIADLITYGALVNLQDENNKTALMYAAAKNKIANVKYLVTHGAHVDAQAYDGSTALSVAKLKVYFPIVNYLAPLITVVPAAPAQAGNVGAYFKTLAQALGQSDTWISSNYYKSNQAQYETLYSINRLFAHAFALYCQNVLEF